MITASISNCENGYAVSVTSGLFSTTKTWVYESMDVAMAKIREAFTAPVQITDAPTITAEELDKMMETEI
jgi:hypothetical protein